MGNKKNMKTLNTLSLIVTLTIFLANAGKNGAGINPNSKPSLKIEKYKTIHDIAGENGAGINPNSKPTLEIQPMGPAPRKHAMPGANGTGINPNLKISTHIKPEHARPPMP